MAIERGEIYALGEHRLMCGDATSLEDIQKLIGTDTINLVLTDPPYGNKRIQRKSGAVGGGKIFKNIYGIAAKPYPKIVGNENTTAAHKHYEIAKTLTDNLIFWGGQYYTDFLPVSPGWIYWDKCMDHTKFGHGELAWTSKGTRIRCYRFTWNGCVRQGSTALNLKTRIHPTQKNVELHIKILEDYSKAEDIVLDAFLGSGTTLIACNETGRKCLGMEISEEYCSLIIDRYEKLTGIKAERML